MRDIDLLTHNFKVDHDPTNQIDTDPSAIIGNVVDPVASLITGLPGLIVDVITSLLSDPTQLADLLLALPEAFLGAGFFSGLPDLGLKALADLGSFLPLGLGGSGFDVLTAATTFIGDILNPVGAGGLLTFLGSLIPGLDASKITSGQFPQSMIVGLVTALATSAGEVIDEIVNILTGSSGSGFDLTALGAALQAIPSAFLTGVLSGGLIPGLDASKIISGIFGTGLIPGLDVSKIISGIFGAGFIPGLDTSKITSGTFAQSMVAGLELVTGSVQAMFESIQLAVGDTASITAVFTALGPVWDALGNAMQGVDLVGFVPAFKMVASWNQYYVQYVQDGIQALGDVVEFFTTGSTDLSGFTALWHDLSGILNAPNLGSGLNPLSWAGDFINAILNPVGSGGLTTFLTSLIPGLNTSKITSGTFGTGFIPGLDVSKIISGIFGSGFIPGLDASKIISGIFGTGFIPGLDVSKIISGIFGSSFIPGLDASKITSGTFAQSMVNITSIAASLVSGTLSALNIPGLDVSKIISGIFGSGFIPGLDTSKITSGTFGTGFIPGLDVSKIISGIFGSGFIPGLDASKIISGLFPQSQVTNLPTDLASKTPNSVFNASAQAGPNIVLGPAFEDSTIARNYDSAAGGGYSTEQKHSGTQSFKIVSHGGWEELDLIPIAGGSSVQDVSKSIRVSPGQKWFVSCWCYAKSTNTGGTNAGIDTLFSDSTGVNGLSYNTLNGALTTVPVGAWKQISGYATVPAGYDRMLPYFFTDNPTTVGNVWYVDDADVHDETAAQNIAQNLYGSVGTVGSTSPNLVADGAFSAKTSVAPWISWGPFNSGPVWDSTQGHTALGSIRQPSDGGCDLTIPALPGQTFTISLWAKGSVTGGGMYVGVYNINTALKGIASAQDVTFHPTTTWAQYTATFTAPAGSGGFDIEIGGDWSGNSIWVDDVVVNQTNVLATAPIPYNVAKSQSITDNIFNAFTAQSGIANTTLPDALNAMTSIFGQLNANTRKIQDMTAVTGGNSVSGSTVTVDFSNYADGPLPSIFTTTYSGTGTSTLGIKSGQSQWTTQVNDNDRTASVIYNVAPTNTDFQIVRGTMTQAPNDGGISGNPRVWAVARCNSPSSPTSFVWARGYSVGWMQWHADIGCTVSGVETVWVSGIPLTWAMDMYFQAGVSSARQYQLWSGSTLVYTYNEVGTVSQLGAGFRYWGAKSEIRKGSFNPITSGQIGGCATSDNAPPTYVGSGALFYRTNTAQTTANNGATNYVSNNDSFFNNWLNTPDIALDTAYGGFQVSIAGWYVLKASVKTSGTAFPNRITLRLLGPSSAAKLYGGIDHMRGLNSGAATISPRIIGESWLIYMAAGDWAYLGYDCDGGGFNTANVFTGEGTGLQTYYTIGLANKSTN